MTDKDLLAMTDEELLAHYEKQWKESGEWEMMRLACSLNGFEPTDDQIRENLMEMYVCMWENGEDGPATILPVEVEDACQKP